jgi:ABC-2 type transport system ATP-binding protein
MTDVLSLESVTKRYGSQTAVRDLSFTVEEGAICGFLGPNGAGKTTTLRMILDVIRPDAGRIAIFGAPPNPADRERIGFLPEERGLYRKMTAAGIITFFARMKGVGSGEARRRALELLESNGLGDAAHKKVKALSKGMAQKVQILAAIAHEPEFVILDEPFSGLDPVNQLVLEDLVRALRDKGTTVLFSTHVMEHAERLCDRIVLMAQGAKVFDGRVEEALARVPRRVLLETEPTCNLAAELARPGLVVAREGESEDGDARWRVDLPDDVRAQSLLAACVEKGVALKLFEPVRPHLHDAFVRLVREAGRSEEEAA